MFEFLFRKKRKVALVLGGGSARGIAHIGVIKVLEREHIPIDMIVGTSMGSLIGAGYSIGVTVAKMKEIACGFSVNKLLDPTLPKFGLLAGEKLESSIRVMLDHKGFDDCRIPLAVVATDINNGEEVVYKKGDLIKIVRASCSWPGIFNPVRLDDRLLVDGGIKNSVPVRIARGLGADYLIAVDVGFCVKKGKVENIFQLILQSFQIMGEELNRYQSIEADALIKVNLGSDIDQVAFNRARDIIDRGTDAAEAVVGYIKKDLHVR